jgi:cation transport regulator
MLFLGCAEGFCERRGPIDLPQGGATAAGANLRHPTRRGPKVPSMPYRVNTDLPPSVRHHLPDHAHRIAWAAVKHTYVQHGDRWVAQDPAVS